jgi:hypothetical protein
VKGWEASHPAFEWEPKWALYFEPDRLLRLIEGKKCLPTFNYLRWDIDYAPEGGYGWEVWAKIYCGDAEFLDYAIRGEKYNWAKHSLCGVGPLPEGTVEKNDLLDFSLEAHHAMHRRFEEAFRACVVMLGPRSPFITTCFA